MMALFLIIGLSFIACNGQETQTDSQIENHGHSGIDWSVPNGWIEERPKSSMRKAQFRLSKVEYDAEDASVVLFHFGSKGGSVRANIERWISQFEESGREVLEEEKKEVNGLSQTFVDISGTFLFKTRPMARTVTEKTGFQMLGVVIETKAGPWFVKFVGPEKTIKKWKESFRQFLASIK